MIRRLWRAVNHAHYGRSVGRSSGAFDPERRLPGLEAYEGMWVAVKDGQVIVGAYNSGDLVRQLIEKGPAAEGAVAQFVPRREDAIVIGVG